MIRRTRSDTGHRRELWIVLVLLGLIVVVPTACVLWFMTRAMANERLAVHQRVTVAYRAQLIAVRTRLQSLWEDRIDALSGMDSGLSGPESFAVIVRRGLADSAVLYDKAGHSAYPTLPGFPLEAKTPEPAAWSEAERLEYRLGDPAAAARAYARIALGSRDAHFTARALQAKARCLAKAGYGNAAIDVLVHEIGGEDYSHALDAEGRLIQADAWLRALELMPGTEHPEYIRTVELLTARLNDYEDDFLNARQRRFLMARLRDIMSDPPALPTLASEEIAAAYMERHSESRDPSFVFPFDLPDSWLAGPEQTEIPVLRPTFLARVWQLPLPEERGVALFTQERLLAEVAQLCREQALPPEVSVTVLPPGTEPDPEAPFPSLAVGRPLTGWRLGLVLEDQGLFEGTASRQSTAYLWIGILFIAGITALALLVARQIGRQMKVARLKNDLVATVTHELKTPLSSMRMLVDTLLDGHFRGNEPKTREYLELIARENVRLSRLIDHFLTFSRMERNKKVFQFSVVAPARIVEEALEATREKLESAGFQLEIDISPDLPEIAADPDAMITVLLNLIENSYKYSDDDRRVIMRAFELDGRVCLEVQDQGIGMSGRTVKKIFDRFYQADRSLARKTGGCGLGLSIVEFVVQAHRGEIAVESRPGRGSTFTIKLLRADSPAAGKLLEGAR